MPLKTTHHYKHGDSIYLVPYYHADSSFIPPPPPPKTPPPIYQRTRSLSEFGAPSPSPISASASVATSIPPPIPAKSNLRPQLPQAQLQPHPEPEPTTAGKTMLERNLTSNPTWGKDRDKDLSTAPYLTPPPPAVLRPKSALKKHEPYTNQSNTNSPLTNHPYTPPSSGSYAILPPIKSVIFDTSTFTTKPTTKTNTNTTNTTTNTNTPRPLPPPPLTTPTPTTLALTTLSHHRKLIRNELSAQERTTPKPPLSLQYPLAKEEIEGYWLVGTGGEGVSVPTAAAAVGRRGGDGGGGWGGNGHRREGTTRASRDLQAKKILNMATERRGLMVGGKIDGEEGDWEEVYLGDEGGEMPAAKQKEKQMQEKPRVGSSRQEVHFQKKKMLDVDVDVDVDVNGMDRIADRRRGGEMTRDGIDVDLEVTDIDVEEIERRRVSAERGLREGGGKGKKAGSMGMDGWFGGLGGSGRGSGSRRK